MKSNYEVSATVRIAIIGRTECLYRTVIALEKAGHQIVLIASCKASPEYGKKEDDFRDLAKKLNVPFLCTTKLKEHLQVIEACCAEIAISMNWPAILDDTITGLFPRGILNAHPGDLPRYRGNACPNWAMINHESKIALTIHQMEPGKLDSGDIWTKRYLPVDSTTTIGEIYEQLNRLIPEAYTDVVSSIENGRLTPTPQSIDPQAILRVYPRIPVDSFIDWKKKADDLAVLVRASAEPFSGAYTYFNSKRVIVWKAYAKAYPYTVMAAPGQVAWKDIELGEVGITTGNGYLVLQEIEYCGEKQKPTQLFTSLRMRLGLNVEEEIEKLWKIIEEIKKGIAPNAP